jgi:hypothetical protein
MDTVGDNRQMDTVGDNRQMDTVGETERRPGRNGGGIWGFLNRDAWHQR